MIENIKKLFLQVDVSQRKEYIFLAALMFIASLFEVISIASIFPYIEILIGGSKYNHIFVQMSMELLSSFQLKIFATGVFLIIIISSNYIKILLMKRQTKFSFDFGSFLSVRLFDIMINEDYLFHKNNSSADIKSLISEKSQLVTNSVILPTLVLISSVTIATSIWALIMYVNIYVAISLILLFGLSYIIIFQKIKIKLDYCATIINAQYSKISAILSESFGGIKEIKLHRAENIFLNAYQDSDQGLRQAQGKAYLMASIPKNIVEIVGMISLAITTLIITTNTTDPVKSFGILAIIAMSAQRLLPVLQQCYASWCQIKVADKVLFEVINCLERANINKNSNEATIRDRPDIELKNVTFYYEEHKLMLDNVSFKIRYGEKIGIIGKTGAGKSTLTDLIMGLIAPIHGEVRVGDTLIDQNTRKNWFSLIGSVSQDFTFIDASLAENVAFGQKIDEIKWVEFNNAVKKAQLVDFINNLPQREMTNIGESAGKLSGGQKQRIILARALYKIDTKLIILDEATSALDGETENLIVDEINNLTQTQIVISHRSSTLFNCDRVYNIDNGKIIDVTTDFKIGAFKYEAQRA
jgi:ABC-type multidrug transport system fused ATPase/permease subunit